MEHESGRRPASMRPGRHANVSPCHRPIWTDAYAVCVIRLLPQHAFILTDKSPVLYRLSYGPIHSNDGLIQSVQAVMCCGDGWPCSGSMSHRFDALAGNLVSFSVNAFASSYGKGFFRTRVLGGLQAFPIWKLKRAERVELLFWLSFCLEEKLMTVPNARPLHYQSMPCDG
jgi:hypothetical protein